MTHAFAPKLLRATGDAAWMPSPPSLSAPSPRRAPRKAPPQRRRPAGSRPWMHRATAAPLAKHNRPGPNQRPANVRCRVAHLPCHCCVAPALGKMTRRPASLRTPRALQRTRGVVQAVIGRHPTRSKSAPPRRGHTALIDLSPSGELLGQSVGTATGLEGRQTRWIAGALGRTPCQRPIRGLSRHTCRWSIAYIYIQVSRTKHPKVAVTRPSGSPSE